MQSLLAKTPANSLTATVAGCRPGAPNTFIAEAGYNPEDSQSSGTITLRNEGPCKAATFSSNIAAMRGVAGAYPVGGQR